MCYVFCFILSKWKEEPEENINFNEPVISFMDESKVEHGMYNSSYF